MRAYSGGRDSLGSQGDDLQLRRPRNLANLRRAAMLSGVSICRFRFSPSGIVQHGEPLSMLDFFEILQGV